MSVRSSSQHDSAHRPGPSSRPASAGAPFLAALLPLLVLAAPARALDPGLDVSQYAHTAWTARDGAFRGSVVSIAQTTDGYLWLGTGFGLLRYDGARFVTWEPPAGSKLPGPYVSTVLGSRDGSLWIGGRGLARLQNGTLRSYPELDGIDVQAIVEDRDGVIWAGGIRRPTTLLCAIRADSVRCAGDAGEVGEWVRALYVDRRNQLWVGSAKGVLRWTPGPPRAYPDPETQAIANDFAEDEAGNVLVAVGLALRRVAGDRLEGVELPGAVRARSLHRDRDGALWIGTDDDGLAHYRDGRIDRFRPSDGLSAPTPMDLFEDREGNVWAATGQGLDRFREFAVSSLTTRQGLASDHVSSVLAARDGSLWVAVANGISRFDRGRWSYYGEADGLPSEVTSSLLEDREGRIWASTGKPGLARFEDGRFRAAPPAPSMFAFQMVQDAAGDLWTSTREFGLTRFDSEGRPLESFPLSQIGGSSALSLLADPRRGGLWLGFAGGGLARFEGGEIRERYGLERGLGEGQVRDLQLDEQGVLWAATQGGLSRLGSRGVANLGRANGLPCAAVHWMRSAGDDVWLYTECGLVRLGRAALAAWSADPRRRVTVLDHLDHTDGVENVYFNGYYTPYVARAGDGRFYFTTASGLAVLDPRRLAGTPKTPIVLIEQLVADGVAHAGASGALRLPPLPRDLRIDYTATLLGLPHKVRFRHRLEGLAGHGERWQEAENRRQAFYQDLPPGDYRFHVVAANDQGDWSEEGATLAFTVLPAFHQTKTFFALVAGLAALAAWGLYRWRVRQVTGRLAAQYEERIGERTRIARELHDTLLQGFLSASMQLSVAAGSLPKEAPQRAQLDRIVGLVRRMIDEGRSAVSGLRSTGAGSADLEERLARVPEEIGANEGVAFRVVEMGRARPLAEVAGDEAYRIGREALVNAYRHASPRNVEVEIAYGEEELRVRVKDDGAGFDPAESPSGREGHWGLAGMRERAERIGARLEVRSAPAEGTEVELVIPAALAYRPEPEEPRRRGWWRFGRKRGLVGDSGER